MVDVITTGGTILRLPSTSIATGTTALIQASWHVHAFLAKKSILFVVGLVEELDVFPTGALVKQVNRGVDRICRYIQIEFIPVVVVFTGNGITILIIPDRHDITFKGTR